MTDNKLISIIKAEKIDALITQQKITNETLARMDERQVSDWEEFKKAKKRQAWVERIGLMAVCAGLYFLPEEIKLGLNQFYNSVQGLFQWIR